MTSIIKIFKVVKLPLIFSLGLFLASCGCDEDCASFSEFKLCDTAPSEDRCDDNLSIFAQDADYITASVIIEDGNPTDRLTMTLYQVKNGDLEFATEFSKELSEFTNTDGDEKRISASTGFPRNSGSLLPVGEYQVQLELTQETMPLIETQNFTVQ